MFRRLFKDSENESHKEIKEVESESHKKVEKDKSKFATLGLYLPIQLNDMLVRHCKETGLTKTEIVRTLLYEYLMKWKQSQP